jgi:hypothetical protein
VRVWIAVSSLVAAAICGGFAFVLQSLVLAWVATALALTGLALGHRGSGWSEDASTSDHPLSDRHGSGADR